MSSKEPYVYLEDLESRTKVAKSDANSNTQSQSLTSTSTQPDASMSTFSAPLKESQTQSKSVKRQLSIADMFGKKLATGGSAKRLKTDGTSGNTIKKSFSLGMVPPLNSIPLHIDAFRASLSEEEQMLLKLELETMGKSWLKVLINEIKKPYFFTLKRWLASEGLSDNPIPVKKAKSKIFPPAKEIYSWSQTPLGRVRVVIIGQDPYHNPGQAHGLSFSVPKGVPPPPSLKNIYAELKAEYPDFEIPKHGNLSSWATNGVLLLNTCLTVRAHDAGSHSNKGWEEFTDRVVDIIDRYGGANLGRGGGESPDQKIGVSRGVVFLAWGSWAQKRVARLDKKKHLILTSAHPSPLSAYRGFFGNNHFRDANAWLEKKYGSDGIVDWCKLE